MPCPPPFILLLFSLPLPFSLHSAFAFAIGTNNNVYMLSEAQDSSTFKNTHYIDVARYITKEAAEDKPVGAQMWTRSRNLEKPTVG